MNFGVCTSFIMISMVFSAAAVAGERPHTDIHGTSLAATQETQDVVYLRNGSIIRGTILEMIPDSIIRIRTGDGNVFVYPMKEVAKVLTEEVAAMSPRPSAMELDGGRRSRGTPGGLDRCGARRLGWNTLATPRTGVVSWRRLP